MEPSICSLRGPGSEGGHPLRLLGKLYVPRVLVSLKRPQVDEIVQEENCAGRSRFAENNVSYRPCGWKRLRPEPPEEAPVEQPVAAALKDVQCANESVLFFGLINCVSCGYMMLQADETLREDMPRYASTVAAMFIVPGQPENCIARAKAMNNGRRQC